MKLPDWQTEDGAIHLYHGDCLDVLPLIAPGSVDAVIDPPYGIGESAGKNKSRCKAAIAKDYGNDSWDDVPAIREVEATREVSRWQIIFGGNYYGLPPASKWLVWDKLNSGDFADCELAWTNLPGAVRRLQFRWNGMIRQEKGERFHPTQKPIGVMEWAIGFLDTQRPVLDSFMGSGTTGVACVRLGRRFIGIERERKYFDIAVKRITDELSKLRLFEPVPKVVQRTLLAT